MTNKCRRRMNGRKEYITTKITQSREEGGTTKKKREAQRKGRDSWGARGVGDSYPRAKGSLLPGTLGRLILCVFHPQNKPSLHQSPTFGPTLYKFIVMGPIWKPRPYRSDMFLQKKNTGAMPLILSKKWFYFFYLLYKFEI